MPNKYFQLSDPLANRPLRLSVRGYSDWLTRKEALKIFTGDLRPNTPLVLRAYQGGQVTDFLWSDLVRIFCISTRVIDIFTTESLTGWSTYPVELFGRKGDVLEGFHGFSITGKECSRNYLLGEIVLKPVYPKSEKLRKVRKGLYFNENEWDKSDFFTIRNQGIVITERVKTLLLKNRVSNVKLTPLSEVEIDVFLDEMGEKKKK